MVLMPLLLIAAPILSFSNTIIICHSIGGEFRKHWKFMSLLSLLIILSISVINCEKIFVYRSINSLISFFIYWQVIIYPFLIFKRVKLNMLYSCILYILTMAFIETICTYAFLPDSIFSSLIVNAAIDTTFGIVVFGLLIFASKHMYNDAMLKFTVVVPKYIFILILLYLIFVPMIIQSLVFSKDIISQIPSTAIHQLSIVRLIFGVFSIVVIIAIYALAFQTVTNRKYQEATELLKAEMKNQIQHYSEMNQIQHEMRAFRHDIKSQMLCIKTMIEKDQIDQAIKYLNKAWGTIEKSTQCFDTGNSIIDALLTDKQQHAAQFHINLSFSGSLPNEEIDLLDLCIIINNAIDNAIEACAKDSNHNDKEILFESRLQQGYLVMRFQNPVFEKVDIIRDTVITTKPDKINHGFGLYNIKEIVKKNSGDLKIFLRENNFCLEIALHCENN